MNAQYMLTAPRVTDTFFNASGMIITSADMLTPPKSEESVNPGDDLSFGGCVIPTVEFEMRDPGDAVSELTGKSLIWYKNILTEKLYEKKFVMNNRVKMVAWNPNATIPKNKAYIVSSQSPFISIYNTETMEPITTVPDFAATAPEAMVVDSFTLYALYSTEPYVAKYNLGFSGDAPVLQTTPTLNAYNIEQIKDMCKRHYCLFRAASGGFCETVLERKNERPVAVVGSHYTEHKVGYFTADKPEKVNGGKVRVHCNGWLAKFDFVADEWLDGLEYPMTLKALIGKLCDQAGIVFNESDFPNQDYSIQRNFVSTGLSALQVLRWAAELAGSFAWLDSSGNLNLGWYEAVDVTLSSSSYMSITTGEFDTLPVDRFQIRVVENDIGVIVPPNDPGDNAYVIEDNPLAYTETDAELRPAVEALYERIEGLTYKPFELKTFQNPYIRAGSIVNVTTPSGTSFSGYVMSKSTSGGMDTLIATGNQKRELQTGDSVQQVVKQLRGSVHELDITVEGLRSTVESFEEGYVTTTTFETTVDGITLEVSKKLNEDEFGTKLRVSAEDVQIAWNAIARTIQFVDGSLQILNTELAEGEQLLVKFDEIASHYYYKGYEVGRIGTNVFDTSEDHRGITFLLNNDGAYMAWSVQREDVPEDSAVQILYINKADEMGYMRKGVWVHDLHAGAKEENVFFSGMSGGGGVMWDGYKNHGVGPSVNLGGVCTYYLNGSTATAYTLFNRYGVDFYTSLDMHGYSIYNESDSRLKTNISETEVAAIHKIMLMDFKQFDWIESGNHEELGLIAQQIQTFFPEAVSTDENTGVLSLNTTKFVMYALKAIQELGQFIDVPMPFSNNSWEDEDTIEDKMKFIDSLPSLSVEESTIPEETLNSLRGGNPNEQ